MAPPIDTILDDLCSRFILNVPAEELSSFERILFQVEQAQWFYSDFYREQWPELRNYSPREFAALIFRHCPILQPFAEQTEAFFKKFMEYKFLIPVCGAIIINEKLDKALLVKGWASRASWGFPKGKINKDETEANCAIREVMEETGMDVSSLIKENDYVEVVIHEQKTRLYFIVGVPESTQFNPQTRKEISRIEFFKIEDLPTSRDSGASNKFFLVAAFIGRLKSWLSKHGKTRLKANQEALSRLVIAPAPSVPLTPQRSLANNMPGGNGMYGSPIATQPMAPKGTAWPHLELGPPIIPLGPSGSMDAVFGVPHHNVAVASLSRQGAAYGPSFEAVRSPLTTASGDPSLDALRAMLGMGGAGSLAGANQTSAPNPHSAHASANAFLSFCFDKDAILASLML